MSPRPLAAALAIVVLVGSSLTACAAKRAPKGAASFKPEEIYLTALQKMAKKRYYAARTILQDLLPHIPPDDRGLLPKVQMTTADAYYRDKGMLNYAEALNGYRTFLTYYPQHDMADRAQFMVGMSLFQQALSPDRDQSLTLQAIEEFGKVETNHPQSQFVGQARAKILECKSRLAAHERLVGKFYQKRKAYLAAIDRYRLVLDKYPHYGETDQVLFDLGKCLLAVGNRPEAGEFFARLEQEDSKGRLASKARSELEKFDREHAVKVRKAAGN